MQHLWLFAFLHPVSQNQAQLLEQRLKTLLEEWKTHGKPISSQVALRYGRFLFIEATSRTSGCSVDWMNNQLLALFQTLEMPVADNSTIFYWDDERISLIPFQELETAIQAGTLNADTLVFDPQAVHQGQLDRWETPLRNTWMARFLPRTHV